MASTHQVNGEQRATMAKYTKSGTLIWRTTLDYVSQLNDFILDEECQIFAVGFKDEFAPSIDNQSLMVQFDSDSGAMISAETLDNPGREEFRKITRPAGTNFNGEYYISGTHNGSSSNSPNSNDVAALYIYNLYSGGCDPTSGTGTFTLNEFFDNGTLNSEGGRGLLVTNSGFILLVGNDGNSGAGSAILVNTNGSVVQSKNSNLIIDYYDAIELSNGNLMLVGDKFDTDEGIIMITDPSLNVLHVELFTNVTDFREIKRIGTDQYLIVGKAINAAGYPVILDFEWNGFSILKNPGKYIENGEIDYTNFWFDYDEINDQIAYADTRTANPLGQGGKDILFGVFSLDINTICTNTFIPQSSPISGALGTNSYTATNNSPIYSTASGVSSISLIENENICSPFTCDNEVLHFDANSDQVILDSPLSGNPDFTVEFWFKPNPNAPFSIRKYFKWTDNNFWEPISVTQTGAELRFVDRYFNNGTQYIDPFGAINIQDGNWHHFAYTKNGDNVNLYLDNIEFNYVTNITGTYDLPETIKLGRTAESSDVSLDASMDELRIWDYTRTSSQIQNNRNTELAGDETGLLVYYKFNDGEPNGDNSTISSVCDRSGNNNNGTLVSFANIGNASNFIIDGLDINVLQETCDEESCVVCDHPEYEALMDFYNSLNGDNWDNTIAGDRPWFEDCDPCGEIDGTPWFGIECNIRNKVFSLTFNGNNLDGEIPTSIDQLTELSWFELINNSLVTGNLPAEFCNLNIFQFRVSNNNLDGTIPACFASIPNLSFFSAWGNEFEGEIPAFGQASLFSIVLHNNQLTGSIPNSLAMLPALNFLNVSNNELDSCYDIELLQLCQNPLITTNENQYISDGNNFEADWEDFCAFGDGQCCEPDIILDAANLVSGVYSSSSSITVSGCIPAPLDITFNAPTVTYETDFELKPGATLNTFMVGCQ